MDLTSLTATEMAARIARREMSAAELLREHFRRVDHINPKINAIITEQRDVALQAAEAADQAVGKGLPLGPLHGVPITVKDTFDVANMRTMIGLPWLRHHKPDSDAYLVARLKQAGAIVWGKTNMPFASYDWNSNHPTEGMCRNPWNVNHSPGGSSGGPAAALAAGLTAIEIGSDVAGSIRHPAHCCGVYGIRPTEDLLPVAGHGNVPGVPFAMNNHVVVGPLTRHIDDLEMVFRLLIDETLPLSKAVLAERSVKPLSQARIAWTDSWGIPGPVPICRDTRAALAGTAQRLRDAGATVEQVPVPFDVDAVYRCYGTSHGYEYAAMFPWFLRNPLGRHLSRHLYFPFQLGRGTFTRLVGRGITAGAASYFHALDQRAILMNAFDRFFDQWDYWLTPVAATTALPVSRFNRSPTIDGSRVPYCDVAGNFCCPTAALGHPVVAFPASKSQAGLPIGLQLHGRRLTDLSLLDTARQIVELIPDIGSPKLEMQGEGT